MSRNSYYERPNFFFLHMSVEFYEEEVPDPRWNCDIGVMFAEPGEPGYRGPEVEAHNDAPRDEPRPAARGFTAANCSSSSSAAAACRESPFLASSTSSVHKDRTHRLSSPPRASAGLPSTADLLAPRRSSITRTTFEHSISSSPSSVRSTIYVDQDPASSSDCVPDSPSPAASSPVVNQGSSSSFAHRETSLVFAPSAARGRGAGFRKSTKSRPTTQPTQTIDPYHTETFPPGKDALGFVPFGMKDEASFAQGNYWPIEIGLRDRIALGEMDGHGLRGKTDRITSAQLLEKYSAWQGGVTASTMRGRIRNLVLPPEHRERVPTWSSEHVRALLRAVPVCKKRNGETDWRAVKAAVIREAGKPFGEPALIKKWKSIRQTGKGGRGKRAQEEEEEYDKEDNEDDDDLED